MLLWMGKSTFFTEFVSAEFWNLKFSFNIKTALFSILLKTASDTASPIVEGQRFVWAVQLVFVYSGSLKLAPK